MLQTRIRHLVLIALTTLLFACGSSDQSRESPAAAKSTTEPEDVAKAVNAILDEYQEKWLERYPLGAYFYGYQLDHHDGLIDNSPDAVADWRATEDRLHARLSALNVDASVDRISWINHGVIKAGLETSIGLRVCEEELWAVNHMDGWHGYLPQIAQWQPLSTPQQRQDAITRWSGMSDIVDTEIANLKRGLEGGYSAAQPVVGRVIGQLEGILAAPRESSPFNVLIPEDLEDANYKGNMQNVLDNNLMPSIQRYRDFLRDEYLPRARESISVYANTNGEACYTALIHSRTSIPRIPEAVYALGEKTVAANRTTVIELGRELYGTDDFVEILNRLAADPTDRQQSTEEILELSEAVMARSKAIMPEWFNRLPEADAELRPIPDYLAGTGKSSSYQAPNGDEPGVYWINMDNPEEQRKSSNEITAVHEVYPGHHLQVALAMELEGLHPALEILGNSGFVEGWARYSEALAEEAGIYSSDAALIQRRAWPARGMVVDPGIHAFGWTEEQASAFIAESKIVPPSQVGDMIVRIAAIPAQLTAYDSGGLEIFALRKQAEDALGDRFDVKVFHEKVLENGTIPLTMLRQYIERWIASELKKG